MRWAVRGRIGKMADVVLAHDVVKVPDVMEQRVVRVPDLWMGYVDQDGRGATSGDASQEEVLSNTRGLVAT